MFLRSAIATMVAGVAMGNSVLVDVLNQNKETFSTMAQFDDRTWDYALSQIKMAGEEISKDELMGFLEALKVDPNMLALMDGIIDPLLESINMMLDLCATLGNCGDIVDDVIDGNIPDLDLSMDDVLDMLSVFGFDSTDLSIDDLASIMTTFDFTSEVTTDDVASFMDAAGIDTTIYSPDVIMETINGFLTDGEIDTESVWVDSLYELMDLTNLNITLDDLKDFLNGKRLDSLNLTFDDLKELLLKAGENLDLDGLVDQYADIVELGISLIPSATSIATALKDAFGASIKSGSVLKWIETNLSADQMQLTEEDGKKLMELAGVAPDADAAMVKKFMKKLNVSLKPVEERVANFVTELGVENMNAETVMTILREVDLKSLIYDKEALAELLTRLGIKGDAVDDDMLAKFMSILGETKDEGMETVVEILDFLDLSSTVDVAEVMTAIEGQDITRDFVVEYLTTLTEGTATEISSIKLNEVLKMLGISEVVVDASLIMDLLASVDVTSVTKDEVEAMLGEVDIKEISKPDVVDFLYDLGVDYQDLDTGKFADVLGQLGVEKPKITIADVEAIVKSAKLSVKNIDWDAVKGALQDIDFESEVFSQKDVIEFLKQVGIEYQLIDPKVFGDFLHKLGVDVPRLTVDDIFEIIAAQTVEIDTSSLDRAVVQEMVDAVNEEADFVVDAEGVIEFAVELGLSKDDLSSREILDYLETRGFLVNNPDTVLENVGIDTEAVRDQFSDIGVDADEILAGMTDPSVKLDVKEISKEWDNYTPAQVLEQLDSLKEAFVDVDPNSSVGKQIAKIEKEMRKDQEVRQKKTKAPKPLTYKFEDKAVANPTSIAYDCSGDLNGGSFFAGITYKTSWADPLVAAWGKGLCGTADAPAMNNYNIILDFNGQEHDTGLMLTCDYKYTDGVIVHRDDAAKEIDSKLISQSTKANQYIGLKDDLAAAYELKSADVDAIVLDNAFKGVESKTEDITAIVDERKNEFNDKFDEAVEDIKQEILDQVNAFTPKVETMAAQIIAAEQKIAEFLINNPNVSENVSNKVQAISATFDEKVGAIVTDAEAAFQGADGLPGFLDNLAADTKGVVSDTFGDVVTKLTEGEVDLSLKDVSKNLNPVLNSANKALATGLKSVQKEALAELKAASKTLKSTVGKDIVKFKKEITVQGKALLKMVKSDADLLASVENFLVDIEELIDEEIPNDIFKAADIKTFTKSSATLIKEKTKAMKTGIKEDTNDLKSQFSIDKFSAGPVPAEPATILELLESNNYAFSFILVDATNGVTGTCEATSELEQKDGCAWGPSDDMKYRYLCELGGSFNYGTETYQCNDTNLPTMLFCPELL